MLIFYALCHERFQNARGRFAKRLGDYLDKARTEHRYASLVLVAPPKFLGALRKELTKEVEKLVADAIPKGLSWLNAREIERYLR